MDGMDRDKDSESGASPNALRIYLIAGEASGDRLGAALIRALRKRAPCPLVFLGVGGTAMQAEGLESLFPMQEISVMGVAAVLARLPRILWRMAQTVHDIKKQAPSVLVLIDSPDFTQRVARRVRKTRPQIPIIQYVAPSVWAWRPGRARAMHPFIDQVLALLPFEPEVYTRLGGPSCTYVGHPLLDLYREEFFVKQSDSLSKKKKEAVLSSKKPPHLLLLPGSRTQELDALLGDFKETVFILNARRSAENLPPCRTTLVTLPQFVPRLQEQLKNWSISPHLVWEEEPKRKAFQQAHAALAASGTVSLELALFRIPMVVVYKLDWVYKVLALLHRFFPVTPLESFSLPNILLKKNIIPEFLNEEVQPRCIAQILQDLLSETMSRAAQLQAFDAVWDLMLHHHAPDDSHMASPADRAAFYVVQRALRRCNVREEGE